MPSRPGALVISLDFELHWGNRDHAHPSGDAARTLEDSRATVPALAELFAARGVRATWATVGLLFARSADEAAAWSPRRRPAYERPELDPYQETIGASESDDPLHLAGSLVQWLSGISGQEIGSHTFSHFYCVERGPDEAAWRADLDAAQAVAARLGLRLRSLVLPRNQWDARCAQAVREAGFECYRGPQPGWAHRSRRGDETGVLVRAVRLASSYGGPALPTFTWDEVMEPSGLCNIPASGFLRPVAPRTRSLQPRQRGRIEAALRDAARRGRLVHLWWHPQNFTPHPEANFDELHRLLDEVDRLRDSDGLQSLSMGDVNDAVRADTHRAT